jgi:hypothetical protein
MFGVSWSRFPVTLALPFSATPLELGKLGKRKDWACDVEATSAAPRLVRRADLRFMARIEWRTIG